MAKKETVYLGLHPDTEVELVSTKEETVYIKLLKYQEALEMLKGKHEKLKKRPGWVYRIYQKGFSQFNNAKYI